LSGATKVTFTRNGVKTPFTAVPAVISDSNIVVTVPAGAATGPITVTNAAGTSNTIAFTVLQAPTFTSFDVTSGSHVGENLVINGSNFINTDDQVVTVKIGTANCPVTAINGGHTQLTCTIPAGLAGKTLGVTITTEAGMTTSGTHKYAFH